MNQIHIIKRSVYEIGTDEQAEFMAKLGGMKPIEKKAFMMLHDGATDLDIFCELNVDKKTYESIEKQISRKLLLAVFDCINERMKNS